MTAAAPSRRRLFRNIHLLRDVRTYRLPPAGFVSILHRASGALMFVLLPFVVWLFDHSVSSEMAFERFTGLFGGTLGWMPGWFYKLVALALIWAFLHHLLAGVRHLLMDANHHLVSKEFGKASAVVVLVATALLTLALAGKLFGLY